MRDDLKKAVEVLHSGGVILYPTDTVWGLGCDATSAEAVARIYTIKRRADSKSMLVLTDSIAKVQAYTEELPAVAFDLLDASAPLSDSPAPLSDRSASLTDSSTSLTDRCTQRMVCERSRTVEGRPLTIIYPKARNLATNLTAEDGSIGIRITNEVFSKALCEAFRKPIVSTSANISGEPAPQCFAEISEEIRQAADYTVHFRQDDRTKAAPSSIIRIGTGGEVKIIRK